jgi:hypothetical protein
MNEQFSTKGVYCSPEVAHCDEVTHAVGKYNIFTSVLTPKEKYLVKNRLKKDSNRWIELIELLTTSILRFGSFIQV